MLTKSDLNRMATLMAKMEDSDFSAVASMYKQAQRGFQKAAANTFNIGDTVSFQSKGRTRQAVVTKVNIKTVAVEETQGLRFKWRVSPTLLKKV